MKDKLNNQAAISQAFLDVMGGRALHHGSTVRHTVPIVFMSVLAYADEGTVAPIGIGGPRDVGTTFKFSVDSKPFAVAYDRRIKKVCLKEGSIQGAVVHTWDDSTDQLEIMKVFAKLSQKKPTLYQDHYDRWRAA